MTQKDKQERSTKGWMPVTPRRASVLTSRHILVLATIASIILAGSLLMNTPGTQTITPPELTPPTEPVIPAVDETPPHNYVNVTGDMEGHILTNMWLARNAEGELVEVHCRANWHVGPGWHIPEPPTLTFVDTDNYWKGYSRDFTGPKAGEDMEIYLYPTGKAFFGYWWSDETRSYKYLGYGNCTFTSFDPITVTLTLPEAYIKYPRGDGTDINAWRAFRRPTNLTVTVVPLAE